MAFLLAIFLGTIMVLQATANGRMIGAWGLGGTLVANIGVQVALTAAYFLTLHFWPEKFPEFYRSRIESSSFTWWYLLPGVSGLLIIACVPIAIQSIGAAQTFIALVAAQMAVSLAWDGLVESQPVGLMRGLGVAITLLGAWISTR